MSATDQATETVAWHALVGGRRGHPSGDRSRSWAGRRRGRATTYAVRTQRTSDGAAAERMGRRPRAAVEPDEHHAVDRLRRQLRDRTGGDGRLRARPRVVQRRDGLEPGAEGPGQRRGALAAPGAARPRPAIRERRGDRLPASSCRATSCCSRRAIWSRPTDGSSPPRRSRYRKRPSPARARRCPRTRTAIAGDDVALGDRTDMVFQNTQVTRGSVPPS